MTLRLPRLEDVSSRLQRFARECDVLPQLATLAEIAATQEATVHLVGGSVRDALLGADELADLDFVVAHSALEVARALALRLGATYVPLDEPRQIARVVLHQPRRVVLDLASCQGPSIEDDLRTRDFTINSMALSLADLLAGEHLQLVDPTLGLPDLCGALIRTPRIENLDDDPLRVLRAVRFAAVLGFRLESGTREAVAQRAERLREVAFERVRDEFFKILAVDDAYPYVEKLHKLGLLEVIVPELGTLRDLAQTSPFHHLPVLEHTLLALRMLEEEAFPTAHSLLDDPLPLTEYLASCPTADRSRASLLKLSALLHDVGKPLSRTEREDGSISFRGHELAGCAPARAAALRLCLSNDEQAIVEQTVAHHLVPLELPPLAQLSRSKMRRYFAQRPLVGIDVLVLALADQAASRGPATTPEVRRELAQKVAAMLALALGPDADSIKRPLVDGKYVMQALNLRPGPQVGQVLEALLDAQADKVLNSLDEAQAFVRDFSWDSPRT